MVEKRNKAQAVTPQPAKPAHDVGFLVKEWESTQQTMELFDELGVRVRMFGIGGVFLIAGYGIQSIRDDRILTWCNFPLRTSALIVLASVLLLVVVWLFDRFYYLPLLIGAVNYGQELERIIRDGKEIIDQNRLEEMKTLPIPAEAHRPKGAVESPTYIWGKTGYISYYVSKLHPGLRKNLNLMYLLLGIILLIVSAILNSSTVSAVPTPSS